MLTNNNYSFAAAFANGMELNLPCLSQNQIHVKFECSTAQTVKALATFATSPSVFT